MSNPVPPSPLSPDAIKQAVASVLNTSLDVPPGHRGALVTIANTDKVEIALATRVKDNWEVELIGSHDWQGDNTVGVINKITW